MRVQRLKMTLGIDANEHSYYDALAHILCYCCNESEDVMLYGMTAAEIRNECISFSPDSSIASLDANKIAVLCDELVDLNILRREKNESDTRYLFSRPSFIEMLGSKQEVEEHLLDVLSK